jgi:methylenetetrahydrofolate reductase (NADPH)
MKTTTPSKLERILAAGHYAVTSECGPPRSADGELVEEKANLIKDHVDAINVTDNQTSVVRQCSLAACIRIKQMGLEPVLQMVTRDRNRIGIQSDILGAASFGINRDDGRLLGGFEMNNRPKMFIGAAANPFADPFEIRVPRLAKKVAAGCQFIQTQCIYNMEKFKNWMQLVRDEGLHEKVAVLAGLTPMKTVGMARYMKNRVPGIDVPDELIDRMAGVSKEKQPDEGIKICIEQIEELKEEEGIKGFHIMAIEWEEKVPEIVEEAGLYPRPKLEVSEN